MNRAVLALAIALLAALPAPAGLVAGSVRDQHGAPIAGAIVRLSGTAIRTLTDPDGTFVLHGTGASVQIRCSYCRAQIAAVHSDGTVVAIVTRYDAVRVEGPSADDLAHLPYARAQSDLSLTPFVVLSQRAGALPDTTLHDASVSSPGGGLLVIDGVPDYDSTAGVTPFGTIPFLAATGVSVAGASHAYEYGNLGVSGTYSVTTSGGAGALETGGESAARAAASSPFADASATYSDSDDDDGRLRASGQVDMLFGRSAAQLSVSSGDGDDGALSSSFSSVRFSLERTQGLDAYANVLADRGTNGFSTGEYAFGDTWSDVSTTVGIRSHAVVAPFVEFSTQDTHGWYWSAQSAPYVSGTIDVARALAGVTSRGSWYDVSAVAGLDSIEDDVRYPELYPSSLLGHDASVAIALFPSGPWSLRAADTSGYAIAPLVTSFVTESSPLDAMNQRSLGIEYGDDARVRIELLAAQTTSGSGIDDLARGAGVAWQIAPMVSVRTWLMSVQPRAGSPVGVGSAWITITPGAARIDLIWRRDLLDSSPDAHLDGAFSAPLTRSLAWFVRSERTLGRRSTEAGLRF